MLLEQYLVIKYIILTKPIYKFVVVDINVKRNAMKILEYFKCLYETIIDRYFNSKSILRIENEGSWNELEKEYKSF